jgi:hypothetical protein
MWMRENIGQNMHKKPLFGAYVHKDQHAPGTKMMTNEVYTHQNMCTCTLTSVYLYASICKLTEHKIRVEHKKKVFHTRMQIQMLHLLTRLSAGPTTGAGGSEDHAFIKVCCRFSAPAPVSFLRMRCPVLPGGSRSFWTGIFVLLLASYVTGRPDGSILAFLRFKMKSARHTIAVIAITLPKEPATAAMIAEVLVADSGADGST